MIRFATRKRAFQAWKIAMEQRRRISISKYHSIILPFSKRVVCKHYFNQWRVYIQLVTVDREIQLRSDLTWNKVQSWLSK